MISNIGNYHYICMEYNMYIMENSSRLYTLSLRETRTYTLASLFVIGNIILPQLCHLIPQGGLIFLPIYFFTLIAAYKYGMVAGMLTAVLSPVINAALFGMPAPAVLPSILIKSIFLAGIAATVAKRYHAVSIPLLILVVLSYQVGGCLIESALTGSLAAGFQDFRMGIPGMLLQTIGGWALIKFVLNK